MHCFYHPKEEAVGQCIDCGKALCRSCFSRWNIPICDDCNYRRSVADEQVIDHEIHVMMVLGVISLCFAIYSAIKEGVIYRVDCIIWFVWLIVGIYSGWKTLSSITDKIMNWFKFVLIFPLLDILFFYWVKLFIACVFGWICLPYHIYRIIKRKKEIREVRSKMTLLQ